MPAKLKIPYRDGIYFITFTCYQWIPLLDLVNGYDLVYQWFERLNLLGHYVCGYLIMPSHVHVLIGFRKSQLRINSIIGNGKRYMAYQIIDRLEKKNNSGLLTRLQEGVPIAERIRGKLHQVWEPSFYWKECDTDELINQKLDYIHDNPFKGKWNLAHSPVDYPHSSARFYICDEQSECRITHYQQLDDIDLTN